MQNNEIIGWNVLDLLIRQMLSTSKSILQVKLINIY